MKKFTALFIVFIISFWVAGCSNDFNNSDITSTSVDMNMEGNGDIVTSVVSIDTTDAITTVIEKNDNVLNSVMPYVETTISENSLDSFHEAIKVAIKQNPDIMGGMFIDLNLDGIDEVVFSVDTPIGVMYTIYYFVNNKLVKTGEMYYWGHWINEIQPKIKIYKYDETIFYCTEKIYSIKDITSAVGIEIIAYYQIDKNILPCEVNVLTYQNTDCSDETIAEMDEIFNRTKNKIEECELINAYPIEVQWTRDDYLESK